MLILYTYPNSLKNSLLRNSDTQLNGYFFNPLQNMVMLAFISLPSNFLDTLYGISLVLFFKKLPNIKIIILLSFLTT